MKRHIQSFLFYLVTCNILGNLFFVLLYIVMPLHYVFGMAYRMYLYHYTHFYQYIFIICFFFSLFAMLFNNLFARSKLSFKFLIILIIIILTITISSPFGHALYYFHDMLAGYFPNNWASILLDSALEGITPGGLSLSWFIILLSIPYNVIGIIASFYILNYGSKKFTKSLT